MDQSYCIRLNRYLIQMVTFRVADRSDYKKIAELHAKSWQQNYRGTFSDNFLNEEVHRERLAVWEERFLLPSENQYVLLVEEDGMLLGFCCAYIDENDSYGSYLDNLHVSSKANGRGLGTLLMQKLAEEINRRHGMDKLYLWVLATNEAAIDFYERLKGRREATIKADDIGDTEFWKVRYVWDSLRILEERINTKLEQYERRRI